MKVAFVNQPIDTILPPRQNSVGACTFGVAPILARSCEVVVYGSRDCHETLGAQYSEQGVTYRFLPSTRVDRWLFQARKKYSRLALSAAPLSTSSLLHPSFARQVAIDLRSQACDVIHVQHCSQCVPVIREYNPKAKIVLHLHAEWFSQGDPKVFERRLKNIDLVTAVSGYVAGKTKQDFPAIADRCEVTYNGINAWEFTRDRDYSAARGGKVKRILYAGAISPHRGVQVLIEAFKAVVEKYPNVHLDLVGPQGNYALQETFDIRDEALRKSVAPYYAFRPLSLVKGRLFPGSPNRASYKSRLEEMMPAKVAEKVTFHGWVGHRPQLIDHYYRGAIFVLPSICNDSFGIPVVEAMASGAPVVATRSGGVVETVKDRETGFIVEKNDAPQMARALLKLLEDDALRESMGEAGRERALTYFTWEKVARDMFRRYQTLSGTDFSSGHPEPVPVYASAHV
jgi:glycosyltransferase involved in cell wall biosynthesis